MFIPNLVLFLGKIYGACDAAPASDGELVYDPKPVAVLNVGADPGIRLATSHRKPGLTKTPLFFNIVYLKYFSRNFFHIRSQRTAAIPDIFY